MHDEKKHHGRFMEGFFWGAVIGGVATYVLSHKQGRELIKELIQDGMDFIEEKAVQKSEEKVLSEQRVDVVVATPPGIEEKVSAELTTPEEIVEKQSVSEQEPSSEKKRRFFKKTKK